MKSGLSLRKAAIRLRIAPFVLKRLEYGYYHIGKKLLARAVELYSLNVEEVSSATQSYAGIIEKPKKAGMVAKLKDSKSAKITVLCLSGLVAIFLVLSAVCQGLSIHKSSAFFSKEYKSFNKYMDEHDGHVEVSDVEQIQLSDGTTTEVLCNFTVDWVGDMGFGYPKFEYTQLADNIVVSISTQPLYGFEHGITLEYNFYEKSSGPAKSDSEFEKIIMLLLGGMLDEDFEFTEENEENQPSEDNASEENFDPVYISLTINDKGRIKKINSIQSNSVEIEDEQVRATLSETVIELYSDSQTVFNAFFRQIDGLENYSYSQLISYISRLCYRIVLTKIISFFVLLLCVAAIYPLAIIDIKMLIAYIKRKRTGDVTANQTALSSPQPAEETLSPDGATTAAEERAPTKKERRFPLFLHERFVRLVGLIALLLGSAALILAVNNQLFTLTQSDDTTLKHVLFDVLYLYPLPQKYSLLLEKVRPFFDICLPIAVVLLFFVKIDIMASKKDIVKSILTFLFVGLYIYFVEILMLDKMHILDGFVKSGGVKIPGNLFLGMTAYTIFAALLLFTPQFAKKSKKKEIIWRSLAVLPFAYLLIGSLIIPKVNVSSFVSAAFYSSSSGTLSTLFVIFYIVSIFVLQCVRKKMYAHAPVTVSRGKSFYFIKNVIAVISLVLAIGIDVLLGMYERTAAFSSGASWLSLIAVPFILFYQQRLEPRKGWEDILYAVCYLLAYTISFSIGIIVIVGNPYNATLVQFVKQFVKEIVKCLLIM